MEPETDSSLFSYTSSARLFHDQASGTGTVQDLIVHDAITVNGPGFTGLYFRSPNSLSLSGR